VLQDAYLEAWQDLDAYLRLPAMPFFLWLRGIAGNKLRELHRHHLGTQMRDPRREVSICKGWLPETTTTALAAGLLGNLTRASEEAIRMELKLRLQDALNTMDPLDREVRACVILSSSPRQRQRRCSESRRRPPECVTCGHCGGSRRS